MLKRLFTLLALITFTCGTALASVPRNSLDWVDAVPGLKVKSVDYDRDECSKEYYMKSETSYQVVVEGFMHRGWVVKHKTQNYEAPNMPTVFMSKDDKKAKIHVDREHGRRGTYLELEVSIEDVFGDDDDYDDDFDDDDFDD
ncbi:hypothetical protein IJT17_00570 [bacterium]|nr:hypothetical protein [bacterium]